MSCNTRPCLVRGSTRRDIAEGRVGDDRRAVFQAPRQYRVFDCPLLQMIEDLIAARMSGAGDCQNSARSATSKLLTPHASILPSRSSVSNASIVPRGDVLPASATNSSRADRFPDGRETSRRPSACRVSRRAPAKPSTPGTPRRAAPGPRRRRFARPRPSRTSPRYRCASARDPGRAQAASATSLPVSARHVP